MNNNNNYRDDDDEDDDHDRYDDNDDPLRSSGSSVDLLAQELNYLSTKYGGQGVLKVSYSPPNQKIDESIVHDLGYSPNAYKALAGNAPITLPGRYSVASQNLMAYNRPQKLDVSEIVTVKIC
ncbi:uncharacterized protein [Epargyreus clarus]|uniref:uncharacterized protein n=1 Tax=Epargyreus clarus TaxID=520877 RepID=UPI003C2BE33B